MIFKQKKESALTPNIYFNKDTSKKNDLRDHHNLQVINSVKVYGTKMTYGS
ncbi:hypothetical protein HanHA300_Chr03g0082791 [Helianthus annuus]|nr:hypothetical protein HanHA300_Chr03g0082791 [Helianthus annuus]KAJ0607240.1 hypothetical protein HanHA89_Chr03g0094301 [Helianthus annuus]KAJ0767298.1 hypothetical protein HanLR1_Chr03g0087581 [Helianthus annuus]KAJ0884261.1 hypothetical protein HanPSC8_Chr10g0431661 [Helianthus annuus]